MSILVGKPSLQGFGAPKCGSRTWSESFTVQPASGPPRMSCFTSTTSVRFPTAASSPAVGWYPMRATVSAASICFP